MPVKIIDEERGSALRDGGERNFRVRVDAALQTCQKSIVGAPMEPPKQPRPCRIEVPCERKFLKAMKKRVNDDNMGVQTVNSLRNDQVEAKPVDTASPRATDRVQQERSEKLQEMGTGDGWHCMQENRP